MHEVALLVIFSMVFSAVLGHVAHVLGTPEKLAWYLQVRQWKAQEFFLALFIAGVGLMFIATGADYWFNFKLSSGVALSLMLGTGLAALGYLWSFADMTTKVEPHFTALKYVGGVVLVILTTYSKVYSDAAIAELAGLPPQALPASQLFLTFWLTPSLGLVVLALAVGYLAIPGTFLLLGYGIYVDIKKDRGKDKDSKSTQASTKYIAACVAMSFFSILLLTLVQGLLGQDFYEKRLRKAIAYSSFHLPASYCGLPNSEGVSITMLTGNRAGLAIPDQVQGYTFSIMSCKPKLRSPEEVAALLPGKQTLKNL